MNNLKNAEKKALFLALLRNDFRMFLSKVVETVAPNVKLLENWHLDAMLHVLSELMAGRTTRQIVNLPPRSLKSIICSVAWPAWILGLDPSARIICVSYGADLANKHSRDFRAVIESSWFREAFPAFRVSAQKNTEAEVVTTKQGYRLATSIDGTITGRGAHYIIIDDPLKPVDAWSDKKRNGVNDWFNGTLYSRLDDKAKGRILVVMQRVHQDDLSGFLLERGGFKILSLPAIAEVEERIAIGPNIHHIRRVDSVLHPAREPISVLAELRSRLGSDTFAAQYQQNPIPPDGTMIKRSWLREYDYLPEKADKRRIFQSWDTAVKDGGENDWSVGTTWIKIKHDFYLIDVLRARLNYPSLRKHAIEYAERHDVARILVEDIGIGTALIAELKNAGYSAIGVKPVHDKRTRMSIQTHKFESGRVFFPAKAPWLSALLSEL